MAKPETLDDVVMLDGVTFVARVIITPSDPRYETVDMSKYCTSVTETSEALTQFAEHYRGLFAHQRLDTPTPEE